MDYICKDNPERFCYISGNVVLPNRQAKIIDFMKKAYYYWFGIKLGDQYKPLAPNVCCKICLENLRYWRNGKRKRMPFPIPIVWWEGNNPITDCYFFMRNLKGIHGKNKHPVQWPDVTSPIRPIPNGPDLPVTDPDGNMEYSSDSELSYMTVVAGDDTFKPKEDDQPVPLIQIELNDLKESAQLLGSCLKKRHLLAPATTLYCYCDRERDFFRFQDKSS